MRPGWGCSPACCMARGCADTPSQHWRRRVCSRPLWSWPDYAGRSFQVHRGGVSPFFGKLTRAGSGWRPRNGISELLESRGCSVRLALSATWDWASCRGEGSLAQLCCSRLEGDRQSQVWFLCSWGASGGGRVARGRRMAEMDKRGAFRPNSWVLSVFREGAGPSRTGAARRAVSLRWCMATARAKAAAAGGRRDLPVLVVGLEGSSISRRPGSEGSCG